MDIKQHLKALTDLHAPSGYEAPVRHYLRDVWTPYVDEFQVDGIGSLIARKAGTQGRCRIMLSAHMDEIGMMVSEIRDGYVRLVSMAGVDDRTLSGKSVLVQGKRQLMGTFAAVPPHISNTTGDGRKTYPGLDVMWVDFGLPAEEVAELVSIGDIAVMDAPFTELKGDKVAAKALDNRASLAAITHCLTLLKNRVHEWDVFAVAPVHEETHYYGAITSTHVVNPDIAIVIDVTFAKQPGVSEGFAVDLGKGPTISVGPNFHPELQKAISESARRNEITLPIEPYAARGGTDAWAVQISQEGIPTTLLSLPVRNMHSAVETISLQDITRTGRVMADFITELDAEFLDTISWKS